MADIEGVNIRISANATQAEKEIEKVSKATQKLGENNSKAAISIDTSKITGSLNEFTGKINSLGQRLESDYGKIFKSITAGLTAVGTAITAITKNALSIGGGFEAQMTNVKIISGATSEEIADLTDKAREMGATLPITAKDAALAMELLAQRGTKAHDILASVADVSALAISQNVDMATAADLIGSTLTNFGLNVQDASKVTDIFNNASNQSALSISKFVEALKYVGPAAGSLNLSLEQATSAMEAAANAGLSGEMIGSGLSMTLTKLASSSHIMGVSTHNLDGSLRDLSDIFSELADKGMGISEAGSLFGQRAAKVALALTRQSGTLRENERNLQNWGATQDAVSEKMKTWPNIWNAFQSATEEVHIEIFEQIKDQSKQAISGIADLTRSFSEWIGSTQIAGKSFNGLLDGLGFKIPSGEDFKKLLDSLDVEAFVGKIKNFGAAIKSIAESIAGFFNRVKGPLAFIINHLETFATISFWGWIFGKGLQVPAAIINLASAFSTLGKSIKTLAVSKIIPFLKLLKTPAGAIVGLTTVVAGIAAYSAKKVIEFKQAEREQQRIRQQLEREIQEANHNAEFEVELKFKTGFEDLPAAFKKASEEIQQDIVQHKAFLQENFRDTYFKAVDDVRAKFTEFADSFTEINESNLDSVLTRITKALNGDEAAFASLGRELQLVTERMYELNIAAGQYSNNPSGMLKMFKEAREQYEEFNSMMPQNETATFINDITNNIRNALENIHKEMELSKKFLGDGNFELITNVSLEKAQTQLKDFAKSASDKFGIHEGIVNAAVLNQLQVLANTGNKSAQSLINGFDGSGTALDNFLQKSQEAITYLQSSPEKFMPALNNLAKNIQRIDPLTGKLTENFKKAHDALNQWANVTFDKLTQRIQRVRKAVEGGFLDKTALENQYKNALTQITMQVKTELEPTKGMYKNQRDYEAIFASETYSRMFEIGGDIFADKLKQEMNGQTGDAMGRALLSRLNREIGNEQQVFKINGIDQLPKLIEDKDLNTLKEISQAFDFMAGKIQNINSQQAASPVNIDQSGMFVQTANEIKSLTTAMNSFENTIKSQPQQNTQALEQALESLRKSNENSTSTLSQLQDTLKSLADNNNQQQDLTPIVSLVQNLVQVETGAATQITSAVNSLENVMKNNNQGQTINIDVHQEGFSIQKKSDADNLARSTVNAIRSGFGNGGL